MVSSLVEIAIPTAFFRMSTKIFLKTQHNICLRENIMEPGDIAEIVMHRVANYCEHNSGDTPLECLTDHSPDQLDVFIDAYLNGKEAEDLDKAIENSDMFWDEVKKEYESLWKSWIITKVGNSLGDEIDLTLYSIIDNPRLNNDSKARRLKVYADVLDKFGDAVLHALQERKPLSRKDLYDWLTELGNTAFGAGDYDYNNDVDYYLSHYDEFNDDEKLDMLDILLSNIDDAFYDINDELRKLEALTNNI
jgi:hypothetical protein